MAKISRNGIKTFSRENKQIQLPRVNLQQIFLLLKQLLSCLKRALVSNFVPFSGSRHSSQNVQWPARSSVQTGAFTCFWSTNRHNCRVSQRSQGSLSKLYEVRLDILSPQFGKHQTLVYVAPFFSGMLSFIHTKSIVALQQVMLLMLSDMRNNNDNRCVAVRGCPIMCHYSCRVVVCQDILEPWFGKIKRKIHPRTFQNIENTEKFSN